MFGFIYALGYDRTNVKQDRVSVPSLSMLRKQRVCITGNSFVGNPLFPNHRLKTIYSSFTSIPSQRKFRTTLNASLQTDTVHSKEIFMPALSSTMTEGKIVKWLKKVGERVRHCSIFCIYLVNCVRLKLAT